MKIPKGLAESVNQRTDYTMTTRKRTNNDLQIFSEKKKINK